MPATSPIDVVSATASAVRAARRSRGAMTQLAGRLGGARAAGTIQLENVELPVSVVHALVSILDELSAGHAVELHAVTGQGDELTTGQAARLLGMSRPTVVSLLDRGAIPHRMVGTHRRIAMADVLAFRNRARRAEGSAPTREERLRVLEEMADYSDRLGQGY